MNLVVELTQYLMILIIGMYSLQSFSVARSSNKELQRKSYNLLTIFTVALHFVGYLTLYIQTYNDKLIMLYVGQVVLFVLVNVFYRIFYPNKSRLLHSNMLMMLTIGFIILARLNYDKAVKQFLIVGIAFALCLIVPVIIKKMDLLKKFGWLYGIASIVLLLIVLFAGTTQYGATNWLEIRGFSFQPSEIVKVLFIFFVAAMFQENTGFRRVCAVSIMAGAIVIILVLQKDLGAALIFSVTYIFMLFIATSKPLYLFAGLGAGSVAAAIAYKLFGHVRVRVMAWQNPTRYINDEGYQMSQSLFAIGTGGWFGMGLNRGLPTSIPVVESDFIFSAISEEFGAFFSICLILIYMNCFITMINIALMMEDMFYRLFCSGAAVMFAFQIFLSIGGVTKFIPSTGVTLPFISHGGSSIFVTIVIFMIFQGIYMRAINERQQQEEEKVH